MRALVLILLSILPLFSLTLQEKIKLAEQVANDAIEGKKTDVKKPTQKAEVPKKQPSDKVENKKVEKTKYVVDVDKDFIDGRYVGKVGQSQSERTDIRKTIENINKITKSAKAYTFAETKLFLIISDVPESVSPVKEVAKACERAFENYFSGGYLSSFSAKNTIRVFPEKNKINSVGISSDESGIFIDIRWDKSLNLEDVAWMFARSIFEKVALSAKIKCEYPEWIKNALTALVLEEVQLGIPTYYAKLSSERPHKDILSILKYPNDQKDKDLRMAHSYWLFKALGKVSEPQNLFLLIRNVIEGKFSADKTFAEFEKIINKPSNTNTDIWLGCVISAEVCSRSGGVSSCSVSEREILRLCSVRAFVNDEPISVPCDKLFKYSESSVKSAQVRLNEIKMLLVKINPLFFNSAVLLGEVYEAFLKNDKTKYDKSLNEFLLEFTCSRNTAKEVEKSIK